MLTITIPAVESFNDKTSEFTSSKEQVLNLEHSLVSLSKWESKWQKAFLSKEEKTTEQTLDYIRCMTLTQNVDPSIYEYIPSDEIERIRVYIENPMTATTINDRGTPNREVVTAELIYYWMITLNIPFECQKWHLNRLLMLINVCNIKSGKPKKMGRQELNSRNAALNAARRKKLNSRG